MHNILIITGGSKGIGEGIIQAYQQAGFEIFSLARTRNESYTGVHQIEFDLVNTAAIPKKLALIFGQLIPHEVTKIVLINNAGTLGQIGNVEELSDIEKTVQLNTVAPLILTSTFIKLTKDWSCEKKIINISSGAAQKPYAGWTVYCATKAAIDMMTRTIALEQESLKNGAKIIAIYPGVVDTEMQAEIRQSDQQSFAAIDRFLALKASNALANATTVGQQILRIDEDKSLANGTLIRVEE